MSRGSLYTNKTESTVITKEPGVVYGVVVNSHTSGTLELTDGEQAGAVEASGTLTSSGASAPAVYGTSTLTSDGTNFDADDTITIGAVVYKFVVTPAAANDVKIGASAAVSLDNLKLAINAGTGEGTKYGTGTVAHPYFIATTNTDTTQVIVSRTIGTAAETAVINALVTESTDANATWTGADITNGDAAQVTSDAATVTIGDITYTAVTSLAETHGLEAIPYQVLWVTSEAVFLDNLKLAINASGTPGTTYGSGTEVHPTVEATTNSNTEQTVVAKEAGTAGNSIATTDTLANYAWGAATLSGGAGETTAETIMNTYTFATGSQVLSFPEPISFTNGLFATIGGTIDYTVLYRDNA